MNVHTPTWNQNYYDLLEFYLFEPQHIAAKSGGDTQKRRTVSESLKRLKRLETPFNHLFSIFFRLAPREFIGRIVAEAFPGVELLNDLECVGREADRRFDLRSATQPDLLFVGENTIVCVEMKVDAKTDAEQIFKYAALFAHLDPAVLKRRLLIFWGPKGFAQLWSSKGLTLEEAKGLTLAFARDLPKRLSSKSLVAKIPNVEEVVASVEIGYLSYRDVRRLIEIELSRATALDGVYRRLLDGMAAEIEARGY